MLCHSSRIPSIQGLRIPVATVIEMVADGMTEDETLAAYPDLKREDIRVALRFVAEAVRELPPVSNLNGDRGGKVK